MKTKFILLTCMLLFARGCDFYSTSLWFFDNPSGETNPLVRILGVGWTGLIVSNLILTGLIITGLYYYTFRNPRVLFSNKQDKLTDFISTLYYNKEGNFYKIFYKIPDNRKVFFGHSGYILTKVVIIGSFLATIHNLCQFYNVPAYNTYREIVKRPLFVIYGLVLLSFIYFSYSLWKTEFEISKKNWSLHKNDI